MASLSTPWRPIRAAILPPVCSTCGCSAVLLDDSVLYGRTFGRVWICPTRSCDARVGAHPDGSPKGSLAGPVLRALRCRAHAAFDSWWRRNGIKRRHAYRELAERIGLDVAHIAWMDADQCRQVVEMFSGREAVR